MNGAHGGVGGGATLGLAPIAPPAVPQTVPTVQPVPRIVSIMSCTFSGSEVGRDPVTEVEDVRPSRQRVHDGPRVGHQGIATGDHVRRGKVALHAAVGLHVFGRPCRRDAVVERDAIGTDRGVRPGKPGAGPPREGDHRQTRMPQLEGPGYAPHRRDGVGLEIGSLERAGPAVEQLHDIRRRPSPAPRGIRSSPPSAGRPARRRSPGPRP